MAKTAEYWQKGDSIDYENLTDQEIPAGTVVLLGKRIGVTGTDIPAGGVGSLHMTGVFIIPKKPGEALAAGDDVVFTEDEGIKKAESGGMGYAVEDAGASEETVKVKLAG